MAEQDEVIAGLKKRVRELEQELARQAPSGNSGEARDILFNLITNGSSEMFCIVDVLGNIIYASPSHAKMLECSMEDCVGKSSLMYVHPDDEPQVMNMFLDAIAERKKTGKAVFRMRHAGGYYLWMESVGDFLFDEEGEVRGAGLFTRNITERKKLEEELTGTNRDLLLNIEERKKAEAALRKSEETYRLLFELNLAGVFRRIYDPVTKSFVFMDCNDAYAAILGYPSKDDIKFLKPADIFWSEKDMELYMKHLVENRKVVNFRARLKRRDGSPVWTLMNVSSRDYEDGKILVEGTIMDISEQKLIEERLLSARKRLRAMAAQLVMADERSRQHFASDIHDSVVQTLGAAKLRSELLREHVGAKGIPLLDEMQKFIADSISEARLIMSELSPPVLNELGFLSAVEWLAEQFESKHGISVEFKKKDTLANISHEIQVLLYQAIRELLVNIVKHSNAQKAEITISDAASKVRVEVRDEGTGFKPVKFFKDQGSGYGLFGIRERLKHFGGRMYIQSRPGKGARIVMFAPRVIESLNFPDAI
ncbi:MAG: PAS domain S-box protein [Syntrophaceae bacterium]